jgi:hypothetical protein
VSCGCFRAILKDAAATASVGACWEGLASGEAARDRPIMLRWKQSETAPEGVIAQVLVRDGSGSIYLLPYPCKLMKGRWVNAASGTPLAVRATHWKPLSRDASQQEGVERSEHQNPL